MYIFSLMGPVLFYICLSCMPTDKKKPSDKVIGLLFALLYVYLSTMLTLPITFYVRKLQFSYFVLW